MLSKSDQKITPGAHEGSDKSSLAKSKAAGVLVIIIIAAALLLIIALVYMYFSGNIASAYATPVPEAATSPEPTPEPTPEPYSEGIDICGKHYEAGTSSIDMTGCTSESDIALFCAAAPYLHSLTTVELGDEKTSPVSWETIERLQAAAPSVDFIYSFSLYGEQMTLDTEYIDLRKIPVNDNGAAIVQALPCMKKAYYLDMDSCGLSDERMVEIRDAFPGVKVVWRVYLSYMNYSMRTDVKTVLASLTGDIGITDEASAIPLTYCTDIVNLDLGHNSNMRTLNFIKYMPNLEVFITYENYLRNVDDLAYAKKLKYLELYGNSMSNINAIGELYELTDLMLCGCYNLNDISPIIPADRVPKLERLWVEGGFISDAQIAEFQKNHPNCIVNSTDHSAICYWRFKDLNQYNTPENRQPQYQKLIDIFHYGAEKNGCYNFSYNDPYYTAPHGVKPEGPQLEWFYGVVSK